VKTIGEFAASGEALLEECERLGAAIAEADGNDRNLLGALTTLEETIARALIEQTMAARPVDHLDQAMAQLTGFRETVLLARRQLGVHGTPGGSAGKGRAHLQMQELAVRLQGFVIATPEMGRQASSLRALVLRQRDTLVRLEATLLRFDEKVAGTQTVRNALLAQVAALDGDAAERTASLDSALQRLIQESRRNVTAAVIGVAALALLLTLLLIRSSIRRPLDQVLQQGLGARYVLVGDDFRFGAQRAGDYTLLDAAGLAGGFDVARMNSYEVRGLRVSSFTGFPTFLGFHQEGEQRYGWQTGPRRGLMGTRQTVTTAVRGHPPAPGMLETRLGRQTTVFEHGEARVDRVALITAPKPRPRTTRLGPLGDVLPHQLDPTRGRRNLA
jgi:hypothetical protein